MQAVINGMAKLGITLVNPENGVRSYYCSVGQNVAESITTNCRILGLVGLVSVQLPAYVYGGKLFRKMLNIDLPLLRCVILSSLSEGSSGSFLSLVPFLPS